MDAMTVNTIVGILGIIVGCIGIYFSKKGEKDKSMSKQIIKNVNANNTQQAQTINNYGMNEDDVIKLSKKTTEKVIEEKIISEQDIIELNELLDSF